MVGWTACGLFHASSPLTQQGWNSLHTAIVDNSTLRRHHLLPQSLGVVHHLKIAAGGEGPPHGPAEQRAGRVTDQEVVPQDLQHTQPVCLGLLRSKWKELKHLGRNWAGNHANSVFYLKGFFFLCENQLLISSDIYIYMKRTTMCYQGHELWRY